MNLKLTRNKFRADGIFSTLTDESGNKVAECLEHAYTTDHTIYTPKLPVGVYTCVRGPHRLHKMIADFETFEIMNVPGHDNILFHWGNYDKDSEGCVLLGKTTVNASKAANSTLMITNSVDTFKAFMAMQAGVKSFILTVV